MPHEVVEQSRRSSEEEALINEYDEQLTRRLIEKITVFNDTFEVRFKSGVTINITR